MTKFLQILLLITAFLWTEVNGKPLLGGISFQKGFELNFKPLPRYPISYIKEKLSPFGLFRNRHTIQKRNSQSEIVTVDQASLVVPLEVPKVPEPRPAAPVFEYIDEKSPLGTPLITPTQQTLTPTIPMPLPSSVPVLSTKEPQIIPQEILIVSSPEPPSVLLSENITPPPIRPPVFTYGPPRFITPEVNTPNVLVTSNVPVSAPPFRMEGGLPPLSTNMVVPPAPGRFTDISRVEPIREYINPSQPIPPPPEVEETVVPPIQTNIFNPVEAQKTDIIINENPLIRGSRFALYFGGMFLQLMSQFMSNARATLDQMTNPPPVFTN